MAVELKQEIGRRITAITEDTRETIFLFQSLSMALQGGNAVAIRNTMITEWNAIASITYFLLQYYHACLPCGFVLAAVVVVVVNAYSRRGP